MITTAREIIKRSLRMIGAIASGEEPTAEEYTDCLNALNTMAEGWNIENLMASIGELLEQPVSAGALQFTMGPGGNYVVDPIPTDVNYVHAVSGNIKYKVPVIESRMEFDDIAINSPPGWPQACHFIKKVPGTANAALLFSSAIPSNSTIKFGSASRISSFSTLDASVDMPPGLKRALDYNLAMEISAEFGVMVSRVVAQIASDSKAQYKLHNIVVDKLELPDEIACANSGTFNITTG